MSQYLAIDFGAISGYTASTKFYKSILCKLLKMTWAKTKLNC